MAYGYSGVESLVPSNPAFLDEVLRRSNFGKSVGSDGRYRRANHRARLIVRPGPTAVHSRPIVPHQNIASSPAMLVGELRPGRAGDQFVQQRSRLRVAKTSMA